MAETEHDKPPTGFPEPPGKDPGDRSSDPTPYTQLNNPVTDPDPTEPEDPYEKSTDEARDPHPDQDIQAPDANPPERDHLDE